MKLTQVKNKISKLVTSDSTIHQSDRKKCNILKITGKSEKYQKILENDVKPKCFT